MAPTGAPLREGEVLLGRVRIVKPVGRGGMGIVYLGEQVALGRRCAVKVLDPRFAMGDQGKEFVRRFLIEASVASKLSHPNVVTIFDYGETPGGLCFIAMEFLSGRSLSDELKRVGPLDPQRAVSIAAQACRGLREAHAIGVVHRDIKPGNLFLLKDDEGEDRVKILDFGLVYEGKAGQAEKGGPIRGSPRYMAPEQVKGEPVDARTDVYALGAVLYAMLSGHAPFERATDLATLMAQVSDAPPPIGRASVPRWLEAVAFRCLQKNPNHRYATMEELLFALRFAAGAPAVGLESPSATPVLLAPGQPVAAGESSTRPEAPQKGMSGITGVVLGAVMLLAAGAGSALYTLRLHPPNRPGPAGSGMANAAAPSAHTVEPPPPPPVPTTTIHVDTVPAGAKVKEEGETLCEKTPCDIVYRGDAAEAGVDHILVFLKAGYKLERKLVPVSTSSVEVKLIVAR